MGLQGKNDRKQAPKNLKMDIVDWMTLGVSLAETDPKYNDPVHIRGPTLGGLLLKKESSERGRRAAKRQCNRSATES